MGLITDEKAGGRCQTDKRSLGTPPAFNSLFFIHEAIEIVSIYRVGKVYWSNSPQVVIVLISLTGNSISTNKRCKPCWPRPWSILNHLYGFPLVGLCDSNAHIFMVIKVNDCCVPHLPRLYQYQFRAMKLPQSRGSSMTNRIKKGSVMPWHI